MDQYSVQVDERRVTVRYGGLDEDVGEWLVGVVTTLITEHASQGMML